MREQPLRLTAVILVDLNGYNGICTNCGHSADLDTAHFCGAKITGVAIDAERINQEPSFAQAMAIADNCPRGVDFLGVGQLSNLAGGRFFALKKAAVDLR